MEVIVPADPVLLARSWLLDHLDDSVRVVKNRPDPLVGPVVQVRRSGGVPALMVTDPAWLQVEAFDTTDLEASALAHLTWGLLLAMQGEVIDGVQCYRTQALVAPADLPLTDPGELQRPRYTMSLQATFRASPAA